MKKILFLFAFMAIAAVSFSQIRYGVKAGLNLANQKVSARGINITGDNIVGVNIGGIVEIPIASSFFFQPGISYSLKGVKSSYTFGTTTSTSKTTLNYLEVPLNLMYKIKASNIGVLVLAGPNIGFGLSGKNKVDSDAATDVKFGSSETDDLKALDFGLNLGAGVEFGRFQATVQYGLGLSNLANTTDVKATNNVISFNLAYLF